MFQKRCSVSSILLLFGFLCLFAFSSAVRVKLSENLQLDYNLTGNSTIEFKIEAVNVTGWVGFGINDGNGDLNGSDVYVGGVGTGFIPIYGEDCHIPVNSTNLQPIRDTLQNWNGSASEINGTTTLTVSRLLNTTDKEHDLVIQNKTMFLVWLYNNVSDDRRLPHTHNGNMPINLLAPTGNDDSGAVSNFDLTKNVAVFASVSLAVVMRGNFL